MILIDSRIGSKELIPYIQRVGIKAESTQLEFGDACFEGNGPDGRILIGIERKALGDMLNCIDDSRYAAHQRPGMLAMYQKSILMLEGVWKPDLSSGYLMECVRMLTWQPYKYRTRMVMYNKLFRYLLTIQMSGITVIQSRDLEQTAYNICECYHYFQKRWEDHTSLLEVQKMNIPELRGRPTLTRLWAACLDGVGVKHSIEAERVFRVPILLARADELDWVRVPGVGVKLAKDIVRKINGH